MIHQALIELFIETNAKTIKDWVNKLEDFKKMQYTIT